MSPFLQPQPFVPSPATAHFTPPHDPADRTPVDTLGPWRVFAFDPASDFHRYFRTKGMLHLQLVWGGWSVLTPSLLTGGLYEMLLPGGRKVRVGCYGGLALLLKENGNAAPPPARDLAALHDFHVGNYRPYYPGAPQQN